jgi:enoyl-CoA hydratase/carnithine racemase
VTFDAPPLNLSDRALEAALVAAVDELEADRPRAVLFRAGLGRWNVVNRVLPDAGFDAAAREFALTLAVGPTLAHAATKRVIRDYLEGGVELANDRVGRVAGELFDTEDLQRAVRSFLDQGPGKAEFSGR